MSISQKWGTPFYEGTGQEATSVPDPFPVAIAGHRYMVDFMHGFQRGVITPMRDARDTNALPGEQSLNPFAAWKRNRDDWTLGAGQRWADRALEPYNTRIELEPRMFRVSKGIDPWTVGQIQLLPDTETLISSAQTNLKLLAVDTWLYRADGTTLARTNNPDAASPTWTTITGGPGTAINDITTDGQRVYIANATGIYQSNISGTTMAAVGGAGSTTVANVLAWVNGWLFAGVANVLNTVSAAGAVAAVYTHPNTSFVWAAVTGSPGAIYAGGQAADVNQIFSINVDTATGALKIPIHAMSLPRGEYLRAMRYYETFVLVGTSKGIRSCEIGPSSGLIMGILVPTSSEVLCMTAEAQYVWWGYTNYDATSTGVGRSDLSVSSDQTFPLPAYASDLMFTGQGAVQSVSRFGGKTYFAISGTGFVRPERTGKYVVSGTLSMGRFRWGTYEPKVFLGIEIVSSPLTGGGVASTALLDDTTTASLGARTEISSTGLGVVYGIGSVSEAHDWLEPNVILTSDATALITPVVSRVTLRALPVPKVLEQFTLPLILTNTVNLESGDGQDVPYDTHQEYVFLLGLIQQGIPVTFQIGHQSKFVTVRGMEWDTENIRGLNSERTDLQGILLVTLITTEM